MRGKVFPHQKLKGEKKMSNAKMELAQEIQKLLANGGSVDQIAALLADEATATPAKPREVGLYTGRPAYDAGWFTLRGSLP